MSVREIQVDVADWARRGLDWAEAILIGVRRSAPRPPGARFAVAADGSFAGTISSGCVEGDLREHLLEILAEDTDLPSRVVSYGITDEMAIGVGLACGGEIDVLLLAHSASDPVWMELTASAPAGPAVLVTGLSGPIRGRQALLRPDGTGVGSLGVGDADRALPLAPELLFAREGSEQLELETGETVFVDRVLPPRSLVIVGATPVAEALTALAGRVGYSVTVVDPRAGLLRADRFPGAEVRSEWPGEALAAAGANPWTDVAILAHHDRIDLEALRGAIEAGCRYVGLLGGRRTQRLRREALREAGVPAEAVARVRGPIGLDIGASTPPEIAVSILAEMLAVRRLGPEAA